MPLDLQSWRVGTANVKFVYIICVNRSVYSSTCLDYALTIFWAFIYLYFFILMLMLTGPIAICATFFFNDVPYLNCLLSCPFTENKIVVTDSLTTNFVILCIQNNGLFFEAPLQLYSLLCTEICYPVINAQLCYFAIQSRHNKCNSCMQNSHLLLHVFPLTSN